MKETEKKPPTQINTFIPGVLSIVLKIKANNWEMMLGVVSVGSDNVSR